MPRRLIDIGPRPFLDLKSYARPGPGQRDYFSRADLEIIARTVNRTPEVMVKVLTKGGQNLGAVGRHLKYLDRDGELPIETDDGRRFKGRGAEEFLIEDWDLDLEEDRRTSNLSARGMRRPPKLVHKILFSMPAGTPTQKVLAAVKDFAREEFGAKHRYAMVLHTDEPHPHVHMVVKAIGEEGVRLNISKATLRYWRQQFAAHLRGHGVAANATERAARGVTKPQKTDGIYRAAMRGASTHAMRRAASVAREMATSGEIKAEPGKAQMLKTRSEVIRGWTEVADDLVLQGRVELAQAVRGFVKQLPPVRADREWVREELLEQANTERHRAAASWQAFRARAERSARTRPDDRVRDRTIDRSR
jgi:Relaxase/Mobilisation nuclease domain